MGGVVVARRLRVVVRVALGEMCGDGGGAPRSRAGAPRRRSAGGRRTPLARRASRPRDRSGEPSDRARGRRARSSPRCADRVRRVSASTCWLGRSTPAVGSSRKNRSGSPARARAISTRCCWPPEREETLSPARSPSPTTSSAEAIAARSCRPRGRINRRRVSRPAATISHTEAGTPPAAPERCGTKPMRRQSWNESMGVPNRLSEPEASGWRPVRARTRVDLPDPLAPIRATNWPASTCRSMWRRIGRPLMATAPWARSMTVVLNSRSPPRARGGWRASVTGSPGPRSGRSGPPPGRGPGCGPPCRRPGSPPSACSPASRRRPW